MAPSAIRLSNFDSPPTMADAWSLLNVNLDITAIMLSSRISFGFTDLIYPLIGYEIRLTTDCLFSISAFTVHRLPSDRSTRRLLVVVFLTVLCFAMGNRRISPTSIPLIRAGISPRFSSWSIIFSIIFWDWLGTMGGLEPPTSAILQILILNYSYCGYSESLRCSANWATPFWIIS